MSMIPEHIKAKRFDLIRAADITDEEHRHLIGRFEMIWPNEMPLYENNKEKQYPVDFVEAFYSKFLPFFKELKNE